MVVGMTEGVADGGQPADVVADRVFGRHTDTAVHLDRLLADDARGLADLQLDPRGDGGIGLALGQGGHRVQVHAARQFQPHVQVGGALGQRLERREGDTELLAGLEVFGGQLQAAFEGADGLGALRDLGGDLDVGDDRRRVPGPEPDGRCAVEDDLRAASTIVCGRRCRSPGRRGIHQIQSISSPSRAETTSWSAQSPCGTRVLVPVSVPSAKLVATADTGQRSPAS